MSPNKTPTSITVLRKAASAFTRPSYQYYKVTLFFQRRVKSQLNFHASRRCYNTPPAPTINARRKLPPSIQDVFSALSRLQEDASIYVNLSQVQLVLRGLDSENAITRIAILGINGQERARKLAAALLADPLKPETGWERQLKELDGGERGLLLRYREVPDLDTRHPLVTVFAVPAQALLSYNLEILIQTTPSTSSPTEASSQDFLVPALDLPNSDSGITSLVTHPVHKSIVVAEGLDNVPTIIFPFLSKSLSIHDHSQTIKGVVDTPWNNLQEDAYSQHLATPVNLILAEKAINSLRDSLDKAIDYEHAWFSSGLASVSKWFVEGLETKQAGLKPTLRRLIQVIIKNAEHAISNEEQADSQRTKSSSVPISTRSSLDQDIVGWAEFAHTELRAQLDFSFSSKNWKKLAWWKLFWRIDDIGYIASDILQRAWLVQAEKEMIWLSGRIEQAGLGDPDTPTRTPDMGSLSEKPRIGDAPPALRISEIVEHMSQNRKSENMPFGDVLRPWPTALSRIRQRLTKETTPPLQAFAQRLLFQTISTTLLTSSLAALLYVSISTTSLYEAGGIGAVGFVYSMHRLQGKWRLARDNWEANVREEGRMALRGAEETMRKLVRDGGQEVLDEERNEERILARDRVEQLRKALEEVDR